MQRLLEYLLSATSSKPEASVILKVAVTLALLVFTSTLVGLRVKFDATGLSDSALALAIVTIKSLGPLTPVTLPQISYAFGAINT